MKGSNLSRNHIAGLDGLRAVAIIGVVLYHIFPNTVKGGFLGVTLFFVLSGYLIAVTSKNDLENSDFSIIHFYKKRIKRIYPALILMVFITIGLLKLLAPNVISNIKGEVSSIFLGYNNWWQISQNASYFTKITNASPFTHLWSLAVELQYYLIWPFLFMLYNFMSKSKLKKYSIYLFLGLAVIFSFIMPITYKSDVDVSRIYYGTDTRIFSLLFGSLLGLLPRRKLGSKISDKKKRNLTIAFITYMVILIVSFIYIDGQSTFLYRGGMIIETFVFYQIIRLVSDERLASKKYLDLPVLSWIGKRSYEIYLWQYPVIFLFNYFKLSNSILFNIVEVVIILFISSWSYDLLSKKKMKYKFKGTRRPQRKWFIATSSVALFMFILGGCTAVTSTSNENGHKVQLEQELAENSKALEEQWQQEENTNQEENMIIEKTENISIDSVTAIGDSIMLGASPVMKELMPKSIIDAKESRQVVDAINIVKTLDNGGYLGKEVIIGLGTNGVFNIEIGQELIDYLGKDRKIYWLTVYGEHLQWQGEVNSEIYQLARKNNNVEVIDWANFADSHSEWFYDDGIHLNTEGQQAYANFILQSIS